MGEWGLAQWRSDVQFAVQNGDAAQLQQLFADGLQHLGDQAGQEWARAISGWDAQAVTG